MIIAHWEEIDVPADQISIPLKVEEAVLQIKDDYLSWVHCIGQVRVGEETLISYLKVFDNFSFWWSNFITYKDTYKYSFIYEVFKLRALELFYFEQECEYLIYCGKNPKLHRTLQNWCKELGHQYWWYPTKKSSITFRWPSLKEWVSKLPFMLQAAALFARYWFLRYRHLESLGPTELKTNKNNDNYPQVTFVTPFPNIDIEKTRKGIFRSKYWGDLHNLLDEMPVRVNWVWKVFDSKEISFKESINLRNICNQATSEKHRHFFQEEFLSPKLQLRVLVLYLKFYFKGFRLKKIQKNFCMPNSKLNFFPLMESAWKDSLWGSIAMQGILDAVQFDSMVQKISPISKVIFPWETQPWELALISAFRRHQEHTKIFAFHHFSSITSVDMRLFWDPRVFDLTGVEAFPLPDKLCIGSPFGIGIMKNSQYPKEKITQVEALRYFYLRGEFQSGKKLLKKYNRTLLVATGYLRAETRFQLKLLNQAAKNGGLKTFDKILIKCHPASPTDASEYLEGVKSYFKYLIINKPLKELFSLADVVYCGNSTGAALEVAWQGIPLIITGAVNSFNRCPLSEVSEIKYVINSEMLCEQLKNPCSIQLSNEYFFFDDGLKCWSELLQE